MFLCHLCVNTKVSLSLKCRQCSKAAKIHRMSLDMKEHAPRGKRILAFGSSQTMIVRLDDGTDIKLFILVGWGRSFLSVAWPTGVQLLVFFCSSVPVVLFDTPGISRCRLQHVSVESSSLFHHSIYL